MCLLRLERAPSTMLRVVPLPRFAGEDRRRNRCGLNPPPFTGERDRRRRWRGHGRVRSRRLRNHHQNSFERGTVQNVRGRHASTPETPARAAKRRVVRHAQSPQGDHDAARRLPRRACPWRRRSPGRRGQLDAAFGSAILPAALPAGNPKASPPAGSCPCEGSGLVRMFALARANSLSLLHSPLRDRLCQGLLKHRRQRRRRRHPSPPSTPDAPARKDTRSAARHRARGKR